ncbi:MAG TPA: hypothetical protein PKW95_04115 [bacterium]|nr:hypothetical protein [bacterium]
MKRSILLLLLSLLFVFGCAGDDDDDDDDAGHPADDDASDDDAATDDDTVDDDVLDDDSSDDDGVDDDTIDDDTADDDSVDDDTVDDDTGDDDTWEPPSPVHAYYERAPGQGWPWLTDELTTFAAYDLTMVLGVDETQTGSADLAAYLRAAEAAGVEVRLWFLVARDRGLYANDTNAEHYAQKLLELAAWLVEEDLAVDWLVVDMEMDVGKMYELLALFQAGRYLDAVMMLLGNFNPEGFYEATAVYRQMIDELHELGFYVMNVTAPLALDDLRDEDTTLQDIMDIPATTVEWDEFSTMVYTSEWALNFGLPFGSHLVYSYGEMTVEYYPQRASIAVGIPGLGVMTEPEHLAADIAAAKAAGVERIQVFAYSRVAAMADPNAWHETFGAEPAVPPTDGVTDLLHFLLWIADNLF